MNPLYRIRKAVREGRYLFTDHARDEAAVDGIRLREAVAVLLTGVLDSSYTDDQRGARYTVRGWIEQAEIDVVCRFEDDGTLLIIITLYVVD